MAVVVDGTKGVSTPSGSAGTPAHADGSFVNGVFFPTSTTVGFATNGTEWLRIPSTGGLQYNGSTSGSVTIKPPAIAGSNTLTLLAELSLLLAVTTIIHLPATAHLQRKG